MKRSRLTRRAAMKPGGPLKRTPMPARKARLKPMATTTRKENARLAAERRLYAKRHGGDEVHELLGGKWRKVTKQDRRFWLAVKREEHDAIQYESKAMQMCRKLLQDPDYFDLDAVNEVYRHGGKEWPITMAQVESYRTELE